MSRGLYLFPNLDFEYELQRGARPASNSVRAQIARWSRILRLIPGWEEAQPYCGESESGEKPADGADWLAWGVTPTFLSLMPRGRFPDVDTVRTVNSKLFSHDLERRIGCSLPGATIVDTLDALDEAVRDSSGEWIVKNPMGVAGREKKIFRASESHSVHAWATSQLTLTGALVLEPRVDRKIDWSLHFELGPDATEFLGAAELVTDRVGTHRGHRVGDIEVPPAVVEAGSKAAEAAADRGYFGPLSVDAFAGRFMDGEVARPIVRPICEINARMSFGRLALELQRFVGSKFTWWHPPVSKQKEAEELEPVDQALGAGPHRLPDFCDPAGASRTLIYRGHPEPWAR